MLKPLPIFDRVALEGRVRDEHLDELREHITGMAFTLLKSSPNYIKFDAVDDAIAKLWEYTSKQPKPFGPQYCWAIVRNALVKFAENERSAKFLRDDYSPPAQSVVYPHWLAYGQTNEEVDFIRAFMETSLGHAPTLWVKELADEAGITHQRAKQLLTEIAIDNDVHPSEASWAKLGKA